MTEEKNGTDISTPNSDSGATSDSIELDQRNDPVIQKLDAADLGAGKPVETKQEPTEKEIREWRSVNFTVRHQVVKACGHKIDLRHEPKHANCKYCWQALFEAGFNEQEMSRLHQLLMTAGSKGVITIYGKKFLRAFGVWLKEQLLKQASPEVQAASGIESSIEGATIDIKVDCSLSSSWYKNKVQQQGDQRQQPFIGSCKR